MVPLIGTSTYKLEKCMSYYEAMVPGAFTIIKDQLGEFVSVPLDINDKIAMMSLQEVSSLMRKDKGTWSRPRSNIDSFSVTGLTTKGIQGDYLMTWGRKFGKSALKSVYIEIAGMASIEYLMYKPLDLIFLALKKGTPVITVVPDRSLTPYQCNRLGVAQGTTFKQYYQLRFQQAGVFIPVFTESELESFGHAQNYAIDVLRNGEGFDSYFDWIKWLCSSARTDAEIASMHLTREKIGKISSSFGGIDGSSQLNNLAPDINFWFYCLQQSDQSSIVLPNTHHDGNGGFSVDSDSWASWTPTSGASTLNDWSNIAFQVYTQQIQQWAIDENLSPDTLQLGYLQIYNTYYQNQHQGESQGFGYDFWYHYAGNIYPKPEPRIT